MTKVESSKVAAFAVVAPPSTALVSTKVVAFAVIAPQTENNKRRQPVVNCTS